jgi:hypothetical protein
MLLLLLLRRRLRLKQTHCQLHRQWHLQRRRTPTLSTALAHRQPLSAVTGVTAAASSSYACSCPQQGTNGSRQQQGLSCGRDLCTLLRRRRLKLLQWQL